MKVQLHAEDVMWLELSSMGGAILSDPNSAEDFDSDCEDGMVWNIVQQRAMEELASAVQQVSERR